MSRGGKTREGKRQGARNPNHKPLSQLISCTSNSLSKQKAGKYKKVIFWFKPFCLNLTFEVRMRAFPLLLRLIGNLNKDIEDKATKFCHFWKQILKPEQIKIKLEIYLPRMITKDVLLFLFVLSLTNLWPCEWNEEESCQKGQQISRCLIKTCKRLLGTNWQLMLLVWRHFCLLQYKNLRSVLKRLNL